MKSRFILLASMIAGTQSFAMTQDSYLRCVSEHDRLPSSIETFDLYVSLCYVGICQGSYQHTVSTMAKTKTETGRFEVAVSNDLRHPAHIELRSGFPKPGLPTKPASLVVMLEDGHKVGTLVRPPEGDIDRAPENIPLSCQYYLPETE